MALELPNPVPPFKNLGTILATDLVILSFSIATEYYLA